MALTNIQALAGSVNYPVDDAKLQKILIDQSISPEGIYNGLTEEFELATAALYTLLVTSANIAEGGYQLSATDKSNYLKLAEGIYSKYGVDNPLKAKSFIRNRSNNW